MHQDCLIELRSSLIGLARELDPSTLPLCDAKLMLGEVVAVKNTAATIEGRLARRIADAGEWERSGFPSPEAWLAQRTGTPLGKARETLETAGRLAELPGVAEAANTGELSPEQGPGSLGSHRQGVPVPRADNRDVPMAESAEWLQRLSRSLAIMAQL
jgi:hypothetical protein